MVPGRLRGPVVGRGPSYTCMKVPLEIKFVFILVLSLLRVSPEHIV